MGPDFTPHLDEIEVLFDQAGPHNTQSFDTRQRLISILNDIWHMGVEAGFEHGFDEGLKAWTS